MFSQTTEEMFDEVHTKEANRTSKRVTRTYLRGLRFHKVELDFTKLIGISDSSFANNADLSLQLGHNIVIMSQSGYARVSAYASYKANRVVRSVLEDEIYAFADCFDSV